MIAVKGRKKEVKNFIKNVGKGKSTKTVIINGEDVFPEYKGFQFDIDEE